MPTISVSKEDHTRLKKIAEKEGKPIKQVVGDLIRRYESTFEGFEIDYYKATFSSTKALFDGIFTSLRDNMDIIERLIETITKNLNPIQHAIAEFIRDVKDVFIEKWKKGELSEKDINLLIQLSEIFANLMLSPGLSLNASAMAIEGLPNGTIRATRKRFSLSKQH